MKYKMEKIPLADAAKAFETCVEDPSFDAKKVEGYLLKSDAIAFKFFPEIEEKAAVSKNNPEYVILSQDKSGEKTDLLVISVISKYERSSYQTELETTIKGKFYYKSSSLSSDPDLDEGKNYYRSFEFTHRVEGNDVKLLLDELQKNGLLTVELSEEMKAKITDQMGREKERAPFFAAQAKTPKLAKAREKNVQEFETGMSGITDSERLILDPVPKFRV